VKNGKFAEKSGKIRKMISFCQFLWLISSGGATGGLPGAEPPEFLCAPSEFFDKF